MPGPLDGPLRRAAQTLIRKFGKPVTLRDVTRGEYENGSVPETVNDREVRVIVAAYPKETVRGGQRITNEDVAAGDLAITVAALDVEPDAPVGVKGPPGSARTTHWLVDGVLYTTLKVDPEYANQQAVTYVCQVRA